MRRWLQSSRIDLQCVAPSPSNEGNMNETHEAGTLIGVTWKPEMRGWLVLTLTHRY